MRILKILREDIYVIRREIKGTAREAIKDEEDKERALEIAEDLCDIEEDLDNLYKSISKQYDKESPGRRASETNQGESNPND